MNHVKTLTTQAATACALGLVHLGLLWITGEGPGLHPLAAGAAALALFVVPYLIPDTAQNVRSRRARRARSW